MSEDMSGYMRPCEHCNGTGARADSDGLIKNCLACDGTGIYRMKEMTLDTTTAVDGEGITYSTETTIETQRQDLEYAAKEIAHLQHELAAMTAQAVQADGGEDEQSRIIDDLSDANVRLHMAISEALGLELFPGEDIERYTEAIAAMTARATRAEAAYKKLDGVVEGFLDDYSDWSPKQYNIAVSNEAIKALMNAFDKARKLATDAKGAE